MLGQMGSGRLRNGAGVARRLATAVCLVVVVASPISTPPAAAQELDSEISLSLKDQPIFYRSGDKLGLEVKVRNDSSQALKGFGLQITAFDKVGSRSALHESFNGTPLSAFSAFPKTYTRRIDAGSSTVVSINNPISELAPLNQTTEGGVFPMNISLLDNNGVPVDSFTTELIYYPDALDTRLNMVFVVPLNALPARGPEGVFAFEAAAATHNDDSLAEGLARSGWLTNTLAVLDPLVGKKLKLGVAPSPRLLDEIADLQDGYRVDEGAGDEEVSQGPVTRAAEVYLDDLRELLNHRGVQPLLVPYSSPDLPALQAGAPEDIGPQLTQAVTVLRSTAGTTLDRSWIFPPAGRVDTQTLETLKLAGAENLFFSAHSMAEAIDPLTGGCPEPTLSFACPVAVTSPFGDTTSGYAADEDLQNRLAALARPGAGRLQLQRFFAETAVIREELPGRADRIINAAPPALWQPSARTTRLLYRGLATAPWLKTVTPKAGLQQGIELGHRQTVDALPESANQLSPPAYDEIEEASDVVESFGQMQPPASLIQRLQRNILVAESRSWWVDPTLAERGATYASSSADEAIGEMQKVKVAINKVVLTSSKGKILLSVENSADYPVHVEIRIESLKLAPDPPLIDAVFRPGLTRELVDVTTRATGIFSLDITLATPDNYPIQRLSRPVQSTEFNRIALGITVGALLFLIGFYVQRSLKRRRSKDSASSVGSV